MDEVITRIIEIERQCSHDIEQAELTYAKNIEIRKQLLEGKKTRELTQIVSTEDTRLTKAIEEAKRQTEATSATFRRDSESLFQNPVLKEAIKENIIAILVGG